MKTSDLLEKESERLETVRGLNLLDSTPEGAYDDIVFLASQIFQTPVAFISLIDEKRQWFKAQVGLNLTEVSRDDSFCSHTLFEKEVLVVKDTLKDARFSENKYVINSPHIRFYAGVAILAPDNQHPVGTICVIDFLPREITADQIQTLKKLSGQITRLLELQVENKKIKETYASLKEQSNHLFKAQQQLMFEQKNLSQVLNALDNMAIVSITDLSGKIIHANENFCQISGYAQHELLGVNHRIVKSGLHDDTFFAQMWRQISSGNTWSGEIKNRKKNGDIYSVYSLITPMFDERGKISCYFSVRFDISKQKELEDQLLEAQKISRLGSWKLDLKTHEQFWSQEHYNICEIAGPKPAHELYNIYRSMIHKDDLPELERQLDSVNAGEDNFLYNHRLVIGNKIKYVQSVAKITRDANGEAIYLSGTCRDRTKEYEAEKKLELEKAKSLQNAKLASIGEMSAGIAHEINNPLTVISSALSTMKRHQLDQDMLNKRLDMMIKAANRIEKIVSGLRKFTRNNHRHELNEFKMADLIEESMVFINIKSHNFQVPVTIELLQDFNIRCNNVEIEQVIINLVNNAIDAVKNSADCWVKIEVSRNDEQGILRIIDSGKGIDPVMVEKIFDPFYTTKPIGEGTGLGLPIVKNLLEQHGAFIQIDHNCENTCFDVRFRL